MSLATLARSSLAQFMIIYSEVIAENGDKMTKEQLESLMWEKIIGGVKPSGVSKIPSNMLKKIKAQLPYLPDIINYMGCPALKPCGGLYVPCGGKQADEEQFCATCSKHAAKFGTLADRGAPGTYTDPNDKHEISYGTWLAKNDMKIEEVYAELTSAGFTFEIPAEQLAVNAKRAEPKRRPGRPGVVKKTKVNSDGSESPLGSPLDGEGHEVILSASENSGDESDGTKVVKAKVQARKEEAAEEPIAEKKGKGLKEKKEPKVSKAPRDPNAPKAEKAAKVEKGEKKEKKEKAAPKPRTKKEQLKPEDEEEETTEEKIVIDGKTYILVGKNIHDEDGYHKGILKNGVPEWIATSP
jgi:hypothetical protein